MLVDPGVATLVFRAYSSIAFNSTNMTEVQRRLDGAQRAAELVAEERPGPNSYLDAASSAYFAGDEKAGDKAAKQALSSLEGVDEASSSALESQLKQAKRQGKLIQQQIKAQEKSGGDGARRPARRSRRQRLGPADRRRRDGPRRLRTAARQRTGPAR